MLNITFADGMEFNAASGELRRGGATIRLEPHPSAVLRELARRPGELVTHEELRRAVWDPTTHVKLDDSLHYCIRQLRHALGDNARQPRFIETIPRRGYRLRADCLATPAAAPGFSRWRFKIAIAAAVVVAVIVLDQRPNNHHDLAVAALTALHNLFF